MKTLICHWFVVVKTIAALGLCTSGLLPCVDNLKSSEIVEEDVVAEDSQDQRAKDLNQLSDHGLPLYPTTIEPPEALDNTPKSTNIIKYNRKVLILGFDHDRRQGRENAMKTLDAVLTTIPIKSVAFEFPCDLQKEFDSYFESRQGLHDMLSLAFAMVDRCPMAAHLTRLQRVSCAKSIIQTEAIHSLIYVAWIARKHGAKMLLVDAPMASMKAGDLMVVKRNRVMAKTLLQFSAGKLVLLLVGNAHTGHGSLQVSIDDKLTQLGAKTMSICTDTRDVPPSKERGTELSTADYYLSKTKNIIPLVASHFAEPL